MFFKNRLKENLQRVNRALKTLSACQEALIQATDETKLLNDICSIIVSVGGYRLAWIGFALNDEQKSVRVAAQAGYEKGYTQTLNITWAEKERGLGPTGTAIRSGKPVIANNILTDPLFSPWRAEALKRGYASAIALPLLKNNQSFGSINIYAKETNAFDKEEEELLIKLANNTAYGILSLKTRAEKSRAEATFNQMLEFAPYGVVIVNKEGIITRANNQTEKMFGYQQKELIGIPLGHLIPEDIRQVQGDHLLEYFSNPSIRPMGMAIEFRGRRKDGTDFPFEISLSPLQGEEGLVAMVVIRDIIDRKLNEEKIRRLAYYDSLTGLPNRHQFHDLLEKALVQGAHEGKSVGVLILDLDRFKEINDTLGHHRGDLLLQKVGLRLKEAVYHTDVVSRLGGDEFGVLTFLPSLDHVALVAKKILGALEKPFDVEGLPIVVETSIGVALFPDHGAGGDQLLQKADVAMYLSKRMKIDYVIYNPELNPYSPRHLALMGELRTAIENRELFLDYQPKIDLRTRRVCGAEALVRWNHPKLGILPPVQFIFPAEQTGLIKPLTKYVLHEAIQQCLAWYKEEKIITMAVNLSARNLQDPILPSQIMQMINSLGIEPSLLDFEITENAIMTNIEAAVKTISLLSREGINFSIDDFGIGYTSLSHLKQLAVKSIKIDRTFIKKMLSNQEDQLIVRSTIELAHTLNLKAIAEGVEDQETLEKLVSLGCDEAQGYYLCQPCSVLEFERWVKESPWGPG